MTRTSCPFSTAVPLLPEPRASECARWNKALLRWFGRHPAVTTVFVSEHSGGTVRTAGGRSNLAVQISGFISAWRALPASVEHIVVIRDNPIGRANTLACVEAAIAAHARAGPACAEPRRAAVRTDVAVLAAHRLHSRRVRVVNLTRFFCDRRLCYPVVGGALVYRDVGHLTDAFSVSLGPYLLRTVLRRGLVGALPGAAH